MASQHISGTGSDARKRSMATFHNMSEVGNQVAYQTVQGDYHYHADRSDPAKRHKLDGEDSLRKLDDEILKSLSYTGMADRRVNLEPPHSTTCQWILDLKEYRDWKSSSSGLLWIKGKPGAGKSTLMSHLYRNTRIERSSSAHNGILLEFFYSARGVPLQKSPVGMLRSLLNQIFCHNSGIRELLRAIYREKRKHFGSLKDSQNWEWQRPELESLLEELVLASAQQQEVLIFVDALDEAGDQAAKSVARFFHKMNEHVLERAVKVKICISCRHYPIVSISRAVEICVEDHNADDIASFIQDNLDLDNLAWDLSEDLDKWKTLVRTVTKAANGIFQWARLVVPMIHLWIGDGDSPEQVQSCLSEVPADLEQVYRHILDKIIDPRHKKNTIRLFSWTCLATRPLCLEELRYALFAHDVLTDLWEPSWKEQQTFIKTDASMKLRVTSWSGGLIETIPDAYGRRLLVQPIHQSVNDFITKEGLSILLNSLNDQNTPEVSDQDSAKTIAKCHGSLYWACLTFLAMETGGRWPLAHPFLEYAGFNMMIHARKAGQHRSQDLKREGHLLCYITSEDKSSNSTVRHMARDKYDPSIRQVDLYPFIHSTTPLHIAAGEDWIDLIKHLVTTVDDLDTIDSHGFSALQQAYTRGHVVAMKALMDEGAETI